MIHSFAYWLPFILIAGLFLICSHCSQRNELVVGNDELHELVVSNDDPDLKGWMDHTPHGSGSPK